MLKLAETSPIPELQSTLDEFVLQGARRMLFAALEAEVQTYLDQFSERDDNGRRLVVRNGRAPTRKISTGAGEIEISAPRVNDKRVIDGERQKFTSAILPPYLRRSPKVRR